MAVELSSDASGAPPRAPSDLNSMPASLEDLGDTPAHIDVMLSSDEDMRELEVIYRGLPDEWGWMGWRFRNRARDQFERGAVSEAIKSMDYALRNVPHDWVPTKGTLHLLQAIYYASAGNFEMAQDSYRRASRTSEKRLSCAVRKRYWLAWAEGVIAFAQGQMEEAELAFIYARDQLRKLRDVGGICAPSEQDSWHDAKLMLGQARAMLWQGRVVEAETLAREAGYRSYGSWPHVYTELSAIYVEQGRYEDALRAALGAIKRMNSGLTAPLNSVHRGRALELAARALIGLGRWDQAHEVYRRIESNLKEDREVWELRFARSPDRGLVLLHLGEAQQALEILETAYRDALERSGAGSYQTLEVRAFSAVALDRLGRHDEALAVLRETVLAMVEQWREGSGQSTNLIGRMQRLRLVVEAYLTLLLDESRGGNSDDRDRIDESLKIAGAVGARGVRKALAESNARDFAKTPETEALVRQQQDLERQLAALRYRLNDAAATREASTPEVLDSLRSRIGDAEAALRTLNKEVAAQMPEYAALIDPPTMGLNDTRAALLPGQALIATFIGESRSFVWTLNAKGAAKAGVVPGGKHEWRERVAQLRVALEPNASTLGDIPDFDLEAAHAVYADLLGGSEDIWQEAESLIVVADGPLGYLPFSLLPTKRTALTADSKTLFAGYRDVPWLARSHATTTVPALATLKSLRALPAGEVGRKAFAGFGDPWFNAQQAAAAESGANVQVAARSETTPQTRGLPVSLRAAPVVAELDSADLAKLPRLPDTAEEIRAMARVLGADSATDVYLGRRANEANVKQNDLSIYKVLAFATHGLVQGDLDGLTQPALALSAPDVAGVDGDGLLTMGEIFGLRLDADWVVLSACNTGSGAGAEAVSGLGRAFFYAGTRALLVSNWPVESTSAKTLTTDLVRRQATQPELGRAEALRQSMVAMIDGPGYQDGDGRTVFSYAHPIFWAPFSVIGDGGGAAPGA
jgi:CHAT domain-containing protein